MLWQTTAIRITGHAFSAIIIGTMRIKKSKPQNDRLTVVMLRSACILTGYVGKNWHTINNST